MVIVEDLGSKKGCLLSGKPITGPTPMLPGFRLEIGSTEISLLAEAVELLSGNGSRDAYNIGVLLDSIRDLVETETVDELLPMVLERAVALVGADNGALFLLGSGGDLEVALVRDAEGRDLPPDAVISHKFPARALAEGRTLFLADSEDPDQQEAVTRSMVEGGLRSLLCTPLPGSRGPVGVLYVAGKRPVWSFEPADVAVIEALAGHGALALERARYLEERNRRELEARKQLQAQNDALKTQLGTGGPLGQSPAMEKLLKMIKRLAPSDATVCLRGETGTGKEVLARHLHRLSKRTGPFVVVDCGALPEQLIEAELFGHEKGAFTGATRARPGRFREADGGTIFVDEIGELPLRLQPRLLRVLQEKTVQPLGGSGRIAVDVRVVSATHRDLEAMIKEGSFRQDLFFRLAVISFQIPNLRERGEDVLLLTRHFLDRYATSRGVVYSGWTREAERALLEHPWPGNVRELELYVQRAVLLGNPPYLTCADFGLGGDPEKEVPSEQDSITPLQQARTEASLRFERLYLINLLERTQGKINESATLAGVTRQLLWRLMRRHGLEKSSFGG